MLAPARGNGLLGAFDEACEWGIKDNMEWDKTWSGNGKKGESSAGGWDGGLVDCMFLG
jgi:hypothetical protein